MELQWIEGPTLDVWFREHSNAAREIQKALRQLLQGLAYLQGQGVIHGKLNPGPVSHSCHTRLLFSPIRVYCSIMELSMGIFRN